MAGSFSANLFIINVCCEPTSLLIAHVLFDNESQKEIYEAHKKEVQCIPSTQDMRCDYIIKTPERLLNFYDSHYPFYKVAGRTVKGCQHTSKRRRGGTNTGLYHWSRQAPLPTPDRDAGKTPLPQSGSIAIEAFIGSGLHSYIRSAEAWKTVMYNAIFQQYLKHLYSCDGSISGCFIPGQTTISHFAGTWKHPNGRLSKAFICSFSSMPPSSSSHSTRQ